MSTLASEERTRANLSAHNIPGLNSNERWHDRYPDLGTNPIPIDNYSSKEFFELEREYIFRRVWLNIGRVEELPRPGSYVVRDIAVCKTSVLLVRDKDSTLKAFHNICSHRCNKLVNTGRGESRGFKCRFHGWAYNLGGALVGVPDEKNFFDLDRSQLGLTPIHVDMWEGFIFINFAERPDCSLEDYLGDWGKSLQGYPFHENSQICNGYTVEVNSNWKSIRDAFSEGYHVHALHKESLRDTPGLPFNHALDFQLFKHHHRWSLNANTEYAPTPLEQISSKLDSFVTSKEGEKAAIPGTNPTSIADWLIDIHGVSPNFMIDTTSTNFFTFNWWPLAADRTIWEVRVYSRRPNSAAVRFAQEYNRVLLRDVNLEDGSTVEETQTVIGAGIKNHFVLQDQELLIRHANHVLRTMIERGQAADA